MNNDLISREALKKAITQNREIDRNAVCDVLDIIDNAPTVCNDNYSMGYQDGVKKVLSERHKGHWIKTISENGVTSAARCSECGFGDNRYMLFRYCPNCGADMRGGRE